MIKKKISMLGAFGVGKSSLVRNYVYSIFDEKYHSTIGVKVDEKIVAVEGQELKLMLFLKRGKLLKALCWIYNPIKSLIPKWFTKI